MACWSGSANGFMPSEGKWVCATPMLMGQWPAASLLFRKGYVKQGEPVVSEQRSLNDLWERKTPIIAEDAGYDPNRDKDNFSKESNVKDGVNPLAFLVGPLPFLFAFGLPLVVANCIVMAFILTNHSLSPLTGVNDALANSLSVTTPRFVEWLTLGFGFHVEHHIFAAMSTRHASPR